MLSDSVPRHLAMCLRCFTMKNKRMGSAECDRCMVRRCPTCGGVGPDRIDADPEGGIEMACGDEWHDRWSTTSRELPAQVVGHIGRHIAGGES